LASRNACRVPESYRARLTAVSAVI
jgi:hypothetical protein